MTWLLGIIIRPSAKILETLHYPQELNSHGAAPGLGFSEVLFLHYDINQRSKEVVQNIRVEINISLVFINYSVSGTIPSDKAVLNTLGTPR